MPLHRRCGSFVHVVVVVAAAVVAVPSLRVNLVPLYKLRLVVRRLRPFGDVVVNACSAAATCCLPILRPHHRVSGVRRGAGGNNVSRANRRADAHAACVTNGAAAASLATRRWPGFVRRMT